MKNYIKFRKLNIVALIVILLSLYSCVDEDFLTEKPRDFFAPENVFVNPAGFDAGLVRIYGNARNIHSGKGGQQEKSVQLHSGSGADIGVYWNKIDFYSDYTRLNPTDPNVRDLWSLLFSVLKDANVLITRADSELAKWDSDAQKNAVIAQARWFRAYVYRYLVWYWGDVPLIKGEITGPKFDFVRAPASEVRAFIIEDLEFASQHLTSDNPTGAKLSKAAADYLLAEAYIAESRWDEAITAINRILNNSNYALMTDRFGSKKNEPGNAYWDLFRLGNQDRSFGNTENIFAWQYQFGVQGVHQGNSTERAWGPFLEKLRSADGKQAILKNDLLGRPITFMRITDWVTDGMWDDFDNDLRNSVENVQRIFYVNNPASANFGEAIVPKESDLWRNHYPYFKKFTHVGGHPQGYDSGGKIYTDWYAFRVAGAYLLRAEAYLGMGDNASAAASINVVRARSNASEVLAGDVDIDYILDERARELLGEEDRRVVLNRTGKLVERTKLHNPIVGPTISDFNSLLPIPQSEIDINVEAVMTQNPGYQ